MSTTPTLLTVREVAQVMRVSTMTVYRLIRAGDLVATRVGRSYRIFENDVASYLGRGTA
jgi:excisionase family DNA binding protein